MFPPEKSPALHLFKKKLINLFTGLPLAFVTVQGNLYCVMCNLSLWPMDSLVVAHRLSSPTAWTCIPCIARRIFNHWTTREVPPALHLDIQFSSVQWLSCVRLFATPWIAARQASLSITKSRSLLKLMSIKSVMPSSHLILYCPLLLLPPIPPSIRVFSNESTLCMRWPSIGVSGLASVLPMNTQGWSPSEWTGWISLQSRGLSRVFSNTTVQKHQFFGAQVSSQSKE